jgi:hypothetical protein
VAGSVLVFHVLYQRYISVLSTSRILFAATALRRP